MTAGLRQQNQQPRQQEKTSTALCVAVQPVWRSALAEMFEVLDAKSATDAIRMLKLFAIDLLVVSADTPDEPFWSMVERIRRARPSLAWILIGDITDAEEVRARCLGVLTILGTQIGPGEGAAALSRTTHSIAAGDRTLTKAE